MPGSLSGVSLKPLMDAIPVSEVQKLHFLEEGQKFFG